MKINWWVDGEARAGLAADDRGLAYGHGLFETMRVQQQSIVALPRHLHRLYRDAPRIGLDLPPVGVIQARLMAALAASGVDSGVAKLIATAGGGGRGYRSPRPGKPRMLIGIHGPAPSRPKSPVQVRLCSTRLGENPSLAGIKHLNRLEQVLARDEWDDPEIHEGLMLDSQGRVIEATQANVFLLCDHCLLTPDLSRCGVRGVMRERVLQAAQDLAIEVRVTDLQVDTIPQCSEMFLSNAIMGIVSVARYQGQVFSQTDHATRLRKCIEAEDISGQAVKGRAGNGHEECEQ